MCIGLTLADKMPVGRAPGWTIPYGDMPGLEWLADAPKLRSANLCYVGLRDIDEGERGAWLPLRLTALMLKLTFVL